MIDPNSREIPVSMTLEKWKKVGSALEELPFKVAVPLINEINGKINEFLNPPMPEAPAAPSEALAEAKE